MQEGIKTRLRRSIYGTIAAGILVILALSFLCITEAHTNTTLRLAALVLMVAAVVLNTVLVVNLYCVSRHLVESVETSANEQEEADKLMREVVGNISHDLKTPITAIRGYAQGILDGIANTQERMNKYVTTIRNKADDMTALVDELSFFAKIYQDNLQYNYELVDANKYLCECVSALSLDLEMRHIDLIYEYLAEDDFYIRIDKDKLKRVIHNIIGNASKYINAERGIVYVRVEEKKGELIVRIMDNGVGIRKEELPMIFDRFYRTDSSRNSQTGGSGLGLSIAKKIVEDHAGKIWAESELGKGTEIFFSLPKQDEMEEIL